MDGLGSYSERAKRITDDMMQANACAALYTAWGFGVAIGGFVLIVMGRVL